MGITLVRASSYEKRAMTFLWDNMVPRNTFSLWPGAEGIGKSTMAAAVIARLTRGELPGFYSKTPVSCAVLHPEDAIEEGWRARLEAAGADLDLVLFAEYRRDDDDDAATDGGIVFPANTDEFFQELQRNNVRFLWIDSLVQAFAGDMNTDSYKAMNVVLGSIRSAAEKYHVTVCGGWHFNKGGGPVTNRIMGSRGLSSAARAVIVFMEDPDRKDVVVAVNKANGFDKNVPPYRYTLESYEYDAMADDPSDPDGEAKIQVTATTGRIADLRVGEGIGHEVLDELTRRAESDARQSTPRSEDRRETNAEWLTNLLRRQPTWTRADIAKAADRDGRSMKALTNLVGKGDLDLYKVTHRLDRKSNKEASTLVVWSRHTGVRLTADGSRVYAEPDPTQ